MAILFLVLGASVLYGVCAIPPKMSTKRFVIHGTLVATFLPPLLTQTTFLISFSCAGALDNGTIHPMLVTYNFLPFSWHCFSEPFINCAKPCVKQDAPQR